MTKVKWKVEGLLEGKRPEELEAQARKQVEKFKKHRKSLNNLSTKDFKKLVKLYEKTRVLLSRLHAYHYLKFSENTQDSKMLAKLSYLEQFNTELQNDILFFDLWFMRLGKEKAEKYMKAAKEYEYFFHQIRKARPFTKSEETEKIISLKSVTGGDAFSKLYNVITSGFRYDFNGKKGLIQEEVTKHFYSPKPKLREGAYKAILGKYKENSTILSEIYKNIVMDWYNEGIKIRRHKTPIGIRNYMNDISDEAVEALLRVVRKNSKLFRRYFKLKHRLQKKEGARYLFSRYHIYAPYAGSSGKSYGYDESVKIMLDTWKGFDQRFYEAAKNIIDAHHVHAFPQPGKVSGAYCYGVHTKELPFILLNHTNTLRDLFTMIHEFGHGLHDVLASKQPDLLSHPALPMAETASVFGEKLLASKLLEKSRSDEEKKSVLMHLLDNQWATIIRQAYFIFFEFSAHEKLKGGATKEELQKEYYKLLKEQFRGMEIPELFKHEWNYLPHIHNSPFYCYAYAWGNLLVLALYAMYKEEGDSFKEKYIDLLSAGGSKKPEELLAKLDIDPKDEGFWQKGFDIIKEEIEELEALA